MNISNTIKNNKCANCNIESETACNTEESVIDLEKGSIKKKKLIDEAKEKIQNFK